MMRSTYVPALRSLADRAQVAGVCDLNGAFATAAAALLPGAAVYTDARVMLRELALDAVLVLTSEKANALVARMVLLAQVPVFLEKPPALTPAELETTIAAEEPSGLRVYTAFNRRHTPVFKELQPMRKKWRRVSGALKRTDREPVTFPYTAVHLLDSMQYFAGSTFRDWEMDFVRDAGGVHRWMIEGAMENGAAFALEFEPDGKEPVEFIKFEGEGECLEFYFPSCHGAGEALLRTPGGAVETVARGDAALPAYEAAGFRDCLVDFLDHLGQPDSPHRLDFCRATIALMTEMEALARQGAEPARP
jgi:virulence factor